MRFVMQFVAGLIGVVSGYLLAGVICLEIMSRFPVAGVFSIAILLPVFCFAGLRLGTTASAALHARLTHRRNCAAA
jgi:hypothetical protein